MRTVQKLLLLVAFMAIPAAAQTCGKLFINPATQALDCATRPASSATNGALYADANGNVTSTATGGAGTLCLTSASGGAPAWGSCAGSASTVLSNLSAATGANTISSGDNAQIWNWTLTTASKSAFTFGEGSASAATGTPILINIQTLSTSTVNPFQVTAGGTANGIRVNTSGVLAAIGSGHVNADQVAGAAPPTSATIVGTNSSNQLVSLTTTGSGNGVLATSPTISAPTISGHPTVEGVTSTGATGTGNFVFSAAPTLTGHPTIEGVTSTGATGTGNFVFSAAPTLTGHPTIEGVTSTGATGTGNFVFSASPTLTGTLTAAAATLSSTLTTNVTGGGIQCLQASNTGVVSGTGSTCASAPPLSSLVAATGSNTIANGNNTQIWNWAQTSNTQYGIKFGETSAATGGTGTAQGEVAIVTAGGSTAVPLTVNNSLTGSQTLPALLINPTWNTTGVVDAAILVNVTNTASGTASLLEDLQVGGSTQFSVDKAGNVNMAGSIASGVGGSNAGFVGLTQGTANTACSNCVGFQAPVSVTSAFYFTLPGAPGAGIMRATNATPSVISLSELSGDCSTSGSNVVTCAKINGTSVPTTGSSFDALLILTASGTTNWEQINGGSNCGDSSHALSYSQSTHLFGCQSITGTASAGGSNTQLQYNNSTALGGITGWTTNGTTTLTAASSSILDLSGATGTAAFKLPTTTTNTASVAGVIDYDSTNSNYHANSGADSLIGIVPTASVPTTGHVIDAAVSSSKFLLHDSGLVTANVVQINVASTFTAKQTMGNGGVLEVNNNFSTGTITTGHLACITASNTVGNCAGLPSNNSIGVFDGTGGNVIPSGQAATVTLDATTSVTFGDILCVSSTSAGTAHDNFGTACTNGEWVGIVQTTAASASSATAILRLQ